jgi:hypothetical protein
MGERLYVNGSNVSNSNPLPTIEGNPNKSTYAISILNAAPVSANYILATIEAGASKILRLKRITIGNIGNATAAQKTVFSILRTTAASTGGVVNTPVLFDSTDSAYSGIARITSPTITAGTVLYQTSAYTPTTVGSFNQLVIDFTKLLFMKPITIAAGITNGIALRVDNGAAGYANLDLILEFTEE